LTNELVKIQVLSKSDFHSSKKRFFFCFSDHWTCLFFCYFQEINLDAWKPDFDQRINKFQVLSKKSDFHSSKNVFFCFQWNWLWTCFVFCYFWNSLRCMKTDFWPTN
jgi:hypothetical protein